jgi:polyribonucleotide nucleotidyltransferase
MDPVAIQAALDKITGMFKKIMPDEEYEGKVVRIEPFGAFVEILPGKDGLVHVSQMAPERVERPEDVVEMGQTVKVRVIDVDPMGKVSLSMLFGDDRKPETEKRPSGGGGFRGGGDRGGRGGDRGGFGGGRSGGGMRRDFGGSRGGDRGGSRGGNRGGFSR